MVKLKLLLVQDHHYFLPFKKLGIIIVDEEHDQSLSKMRE